MASGTTVDLKGDDLAGGDLPTSTKSEIQEVLRDRRSARWRRNVIFYVGLGAALIAAVAVGCWVFSNRHLVADEFATNQTVALFVAPIVAFTSIALTLFIGLLRSEGNPRASGESDQKSVASFEGIPAVAIAALLRDLYGGVTGRDRAP